MFSGHFHVRVELKMNLVFRDTPSGKSLISRHHISRLRHEPFTGPLISMVQDKLLLNANCFCALMKVLWWISSCADPVESTTIFPFDILLGTDYLRGIRLLIDAHAMFHTIFVTTGIENKLKLVLPHIRAVLGHTVLSSGEGSNHLNNHITPMNRSNRQRLASISNLTGLSTCPNYRLSDFHRKSSRLYRNGIRFFTPNCYGKMEVRSISPNK